jgi:hypothetical protein
MNDNAEFLINRGACIAGKPAPTRTGPEQGQVFQRLRFTERTTIVQTDGTLIGIVPPLFA